MEQKIYNQKRYNQLWSYGDVQNPEIWSVWEIVKNFKGKVNLEIGSGNYPKIPVNGGYFLDISEKAVRNLKRAGGKSFLGDIINLPFKDNFFDLVLAMEVLEHIEDDRKALSEIARVLKPTGFFLFSVPLGMEFFSEIDLIFGHKRRYETKELKEMLLEKKFRILKYRGPSFYLEAMNKVGDFFHLTNLLYKSKGSVKFFHLPKFIVNLYADILAFLERKGVPNWKEDKESFLKYKGRRITVFCQINKG